ncbi:FAD/NAD(P)-binding domain-containing protein [Tothia fuscella]|uniref:FAD/NAD(P)-binding domain-containing protein n=1 Tax=Tothia fuscella TaxID=1048955 RepID=A0A9P4U3B1_9PEZI|nr:FAD/NAD(P)-binding domain-containing protein [Tothia fuscella]
MKIIIVGGGISGLSAYLSFKKYLKTGTHTISIYEKHHSQLNATSTTNDGETTTSTFEELSSSGAIVGGGLGVSPNGMRILKELSLDLHDAVDKQGFRAEQFVFRSSRGWRLSSQPTSDRRIEDGEEVCVASSRHGLWQCLRDEVARVDKDILRYRKVIGVEMGDEAGSRRPRVLFEDGEEEEADLVVGADGVKSIVKDAIFGDVDAFKPVYEGMIGVGGFLPNSSLPPLPPCDANSMVFTFGPNGFFGYSPSSPDTTMWWSTCEAENIPATTRISTSDMQSQLKAHHEKWKDPTIKAIIQKADVESIYPVWTTPELPHWGKGGVILVGDAAHGLNPTSGQGSSQAMEDTKTLAILLERFMNQTNAGGRTHEQALSLPEAIDRTIRVLYEVRNQRIDKIVQRTKMMSNRKKEQGFVEEMVTCFFLWLIGKVPAAGKLVVGDVLKELYRWDVYAEIEIALKKLELDG